MSANLTMPGLNMPADPPTWQGTSTGLPARDGGLWQSLWQAAPSGASAATAPAPDQAVLSMRHLLDLRGASANPLAVLHGERPGPFDAQGAPPSSHADRVNTPAHAFDGPSRAIGAGEDPEHPGAPHAPGTSPAKNALTRAAAQASALIAHGTSASASASASATNNAALTDDTRTGDAQEAPDVPDTSPIVAMTPLSPQADAPRAGTGGTVGTRPPRATVSDPHGPVRIHVEWHDDLAHVWIGVDASGWARRDVLQRAVLTWLDARGARLGRLVCNGEVQVLAAAAPDRDTPAPHFSRHHP